MALPALPILFGIVTTLSVIGKWLVEMAVMYGRKVAFFTIVVSLFYASLYVISSALFGALNLVPVSSYTGNAYPYFTIAIAIFPSNFTAISALVISIEFQIFFWKWANKVLNLKVDFFG